MAVITGTNSADNLSGTSASDQISGGLGNDTLAGLDGDDFIEGGSGNDSLLGGTGADVFVYATRQFGADTIGDFGAGDRIDLSALNVSDFSLLQRYISTSGPNLNIDLGFLGSTERITLVGVTSVSAANFIFRTDPSSLTVNGSNGADVLFGGSGADQMFGGLGSDDLSAGAGNDYLEGGSGDDLLVGGAGADVFGYTTRQFGADTIADFAAGDRIDLSALNVSEFSQLQRYITTSGPNLIIDLGYLGSTERITLLNTPSTSISASSFIFRTDPSSLTVNGSNGADVLFGGLASDQMFGGLGSDDLSGGAGDDYLEGGSGDDLLIGGAGADVFGYTDRQFGADTIADFGAGDRIDLSALHVTNLESIRAFFSQSGPNASISLGYLGSTEKITILNTASTSLTSASFIFDTSTQEMNVTGSNGRDVLFGRLGDDQIFGGLGDDTIVESAGKNYLRGDDGNDSIIGGSGFDDINGNMGNDTINAGTGDSWAVGGKDNDSLAGGIGQNLVYGNIGNDTCDGGAGNDIVRGGQDNDVCFGGAGDDFVSGDKGSDTMTGGTGADIFHTFGDAGLDVVTDFSLAQGDRVMLDPGTSFTVSQNGADTVINMVGGGQMILQNVQMSTLTPGWIFGA